MIQLNPREVAAQTLVEILGEKTYNNLALKRQLRQNGAMQSKDKAFVTEIVNGVLRNINYIDYIIDSVATIKVDKMKPWIATALRMGVYQIYFMNVPDSAACNESVNLVKEKGFGKLSGFANGVLRSVIRNKESLTLPDETKNALEYLEVRYSHPIWLLRMWNHYYGYEFVRALCEKNNEPAEVTVCTNTLKITIEKLQEKLLSYDIMVKAGRYHPQALRISKTADIAAMPYFQEGFFHVQDESSMLAVEVLAPVEGERILDLCAAPGGKSFLIAEKMNNTGTVISRDIHPHKLLLVEEGAKRLGITNLRTQQKDGALFEEADICAFDRVLVDAPCSGLGLIRKKPDIRFSKHGKDIDELSLIQKNILTQGAKYVKPGGVLVYSTCTICKKENERNVEAFLSDNQDFSLDSLVPFMPEAFHNESGLNQGFTTLFPHIHETDGFFIARFIRKEHINHGEN